MNNNMGNWRTCTVYVEKVHEIIELENVYENGS